ncbi:MAG: MOSC domain-containing protein [Pseudomonadota bacterium]
MTSHTLLSVLVGQPEPTPAKAGMTGHFKTPVSAAKVDTPGLSGDHIMDLENHGGVDQAVYIFGEVDRVWWAQELGRDVSPGYFGENLLISDLETGALACGDQFRIGDVLLEITSPRIPCATYAAHIGSGQAIKQFYASRRPGAYARVLETGTLKPGQDVVITPYAGDRVTMAELLRHRLTNYRDDAFVARFRDIPIHQELRQMAADRQA